MAYRKSGASPLVRLRTGRIIVLTGLLAIIAEFYMKLFPKVRGMPCRKHEERTMLQCTI